MKRACVIVTGGAQGIGAAVARCLAAGDFNVAVFDRKRDAGETELNTCRAFFEVDVSDESSVKHGIEAVSQHFGQIGALVNNAGIRQSGYRCAGVALAGAMEPHHRH
ncbi:MAG: SDR family NAD(P)-dependent oxidoreductase [Gammaproteobacteria bacterium]